MTGSAPPKERAKECVLGIDGVLLKLLTDFEYIAGILGTTSHTGECLTTLRFRKKFLIGNKSRPGMDIYEVTSPKHIFASEAFRDLVSGIFEIQKITALSQLNGFIIVVPIESEINMRIIDIIQNSSLEVYEKAR